MANPKTTLRELLAETTSMALVASAALPPDPVAAGNPDEAVIEALKRVLGTTFCLYLKTQAAHWNVEGPTFGQLHAMFGEHYRDLWEAVDDIAERIRMLDAYAPCALHRMMELSAVACWDEVPPVPEALVALVADHEVAGALVTEAFGVAERANRQGVADYLAGRVTAHAKMRWFLRATAKGLPV